MSPLTPHPSGVVILVRAMPRAGRSGVAGVRGDALLVRLAAAPVDGAANDELIAILAQTLDIPRRRLSLRSGERGRDKRVLVEGATIAEIEAKLSHILAQAEKHSM